MSNKISNQKQNIKNNYFPMSLIGNLNFDIYLSFVIRNWSLTLCVVFLMFFFSTHNVFASTIAKPSNFLTLNTGLVGWWTFDGKDIDMNIRDKSGNGNHGSLNFGTSGNIATSSMQKPGKIGQALSFDGVDDRVKITNNIADNMSAITVSVWVKDAVASHNSTIFVSKIRTTGTTAASWYMDKNSSNRFSFFIVNDSSTLHGASSFFMFADTNWHHVVGTYDGSNIIVYVDGVAGTPVAQTGIIKSSPSYPVCINGGNSDSTGRCNDNFSTAIIDDVRIYNRALSATEIRQLYNMSSATKVASSPRTGQTTSCTSGLSCGLVGHWTFDGPDMIQNVKDKSGNNNHSFLSFNTSGNIATSSMQKPGKIGQALSFDGVDDYVITPNLPAINNAGPLTVGVWFKANASGVIVSEIGQPTINTNWHDAWIEVLSDGTVAVRVWPCGGNYLGNVSFGTWNYAAITYTPGFLGGYLNGNSATPSVCDRQYPGGSALNEYLAFGATDGTNMGSGAYFNGLVDEARVYNRVITPQEAKQIYNLGVANKLSSSQKTGVTTGCSSGLSCGLVGHWTFDGKDTIQNIVDKSGLGNHGYFYYNTATTSAQVPGKIGQAFLLNGVNNIIRVPDYDLADNTNTISVGAWVKFSVPASANAYPIVSKTRSVSGFSGWILYRGSDEKYAFYVSSGVGSSAAVSNNIYADTNWHYIMGVYDGSSVQVYVDGVASDSTPGSYSNTLVNNTRSVCMGVAVGNDDACGSATVFTPGAIDDVRIYNRALSDTEIKQLYNLGR